MIVTRKNISYKDKITVLKKNCDCYIPYRVNF